MSTRPAPSATAPVRRTTAPEIARRKGGEPIVSLTSYHAHTAAIADAYCDFLLVGDSLGMVMHGYETTVPVPLELMIMHGRAVVRGAKRALVVVDMPFGSYEESPAKAFQSAVRVMKETGCGAVKMEGGAHMAETVRFLVHFHPVAASRLIDPADEAVGKKARVFLLESAHPLDRRFDEPAGVGLLLLDERDVAVGAHRTEADLSAARNRCRGH